MSCSFCNQASGGGSLSGGGSGSDDTTIAGVGVKTWCSKCASFWALVVVIVLLVLFYRKG
jgi:hypothetical protein